MSDVTEFLTAMQMLQRGMQDVAQGSIISQATADMKLAKEQIKDDQERFLALQNLSSDLALRLSGAGADPTKVAQTMKAVAPQFATADEAIFQGAMSGSDQLMQLGQRAKSAQNADEIAFQNRQLALQEKQLEAKSRADMGLEAFDPGQYTWEQVQPNLRKLPKDARELAIPNLGIAASTEDKKGIQAAIAPYVSLEKDVEAINELLAKGGDSAFSVQGRSRISAVKARIVGALNKKLYGGGPMTAQERELAQEAVGSIEDITDFSGAKRLIWEEFSRSVPELKKAAIGSYAYTPFKNVGGSTDTDARMDALVEAIKKENPNSPLLKQYELVKALKSQGAK